MRTFKALRGVMLGMCLATSLLMVMMPGEALAKKPKVLLSEAEQTELKEILKHVKYESSGIGGKPTVLVMGANVQIVNGEGKTASANGTGNLVIGYDENPGSHAQTGSHDLILGEEQAFTSFGGIVAGRTNAIDGEFASVTGGEGNVAFGSESSVSGGQLNAADGVFSSVSGGYSNSATGINTSVSGGSHNTAKTGSISGGDENVTEGLRASVSGGALNTVKGEFAWVGGGYKNLVAEGKYSAIFGGKEGKTTNDYEAIP